LRLFSFGGYGLARAALALVVFGAYYSYLFFFNEISVFIRSSCAIYSVKSAQIETLFFLFHKHCKINFDGENSDLLIGVIDF